MQVCFVKKSENRKTGPIPVTMVSSDTCPSTCPFIDKGCYAKYGSLRSIWNRINAKTLGGSFAEALKGIAELKPNQLWRWGVVGDLPGTDTQIDEEALEQLVEANRGRRGFGYTHKPMTEVNARLVAHANRNGFTVNLSADSPAGAQALLDLGVAPVVLSGPRKLEEWPKRTAKGVPIVPCMAVTHEYRTCANCQWCADPKRKFVVGFPAHGSGAKYVEAHFRSVND